MNHGFRLLTVSVLALLVQTGRAAPLIIDHRHTDLTKLTQPQIAKAKQVLHIAYGHTSHGSQLTSGMAGLVDFANQGGKGLKLPKDFLSFNRGGHEGALDLHDNAMKGDVGYYPQWVEQTKAYLDNPANAKVNVIIWSWCGQMTGKFKSGSLESEYLEPMSKLEKAYPKVTFVYMTGHADIGSDAAQKGACQAIRDFCKANGKVLYDFADLEHYDPDGKFYEFVDDNCGVYATPGKPTQTNWALQWQKSHQEGVDWYACGSAHSQALNANQKAYAAWHLWCALAERIAK